MRPLLLPLLILSGGAFAEGLRQFRAGDPAAALTSFERALAAEGETASSALHYDRALAALHCGAWEAVEESAQILLGRETERWTVRASLLRGCAAALRAEEAARLAAAPGAIPADWDLALARGRSALAAFALALDSSASDLPEARRNAARVMLRLALWQDARRRAEPPRGDAAPAPQPHPARVEELMQRLDQMQRPPDARAAPEAQRAQQDW